MPEKVKKHFEEASLKSIKIDVSEVIELLSEFENKGMVVKVENNGYVYTGIGEIKNHRAMIAGNPTLEIAELRVTFDHYGTRLSISTDDAGNLNEHTLDDAKTFLSKFEISWLRQNWFWLTGLFPFLLTPYLDTITEKLLPQIFGTDVKKSGIILVCIIVLGWVVSSYAWYKSEKTFTAVLFNPKETNWQKYKSEIMVGTTLLIIGLILGKISNALL